MKKVLLILVVHFFTLSLGLRAQVQFTQSTELMSIEFNLSLFDLADMDNDGDLDFVGINFIGVLESIPTYALVVHYNNSDGTVAPALHLPIEQRNYREIIATDIDQDGNVDILYTVGSAGNSVSKMMGFFKNEGNNQFTEQVLESSDSKGFSIKGAKDMNGDGHLDVVYLKSAISGQVPRDAQYYINDGAGNFLSNEFITSQSESLHAVEDMDSDGLPDYITLVVDFGLTYLPSNAGSFNEQILITDSVTHQNDISSAIVSDINGDGSLDILLCYENRLVWFSNNGEGVFSDEILLINDINAQHILPFDIDNDNELDLIIQQQSVFFGLTGSIGYFRNLGQNEYAPYVEFEDNIRNLESVNNHDFDEDGDEDLLFIDNSDALGLSPIEKLRLHWSENLLEVPQSGFAFNVCTQETMNLSSANYTDHTFEWTVDGVFYSSDLNPNFQFEELGTYTIGLEVCNNNICDFKDETIEISHLFEVDVPFSGMVNEELTFTDLSIGFNSWTWVFGDGVVSFDAIAKHMYTQPGWYTLEYFATDTSQTNCTVQFTQEIEIAGQVGIDNHESNGLSIYPNPCTEFFVLESENNESCEYRLFNSSGILVHQGNSSDGPKEISMTNVATGVYVLSVTTDTEIVNEKLIVLD